MGERLRRVLSLDLRSLALFRIAFGTYLVLNLATRLPYLTDFYTDSGIVPREAIIRLWPKPWVVSLNYLSGEAWVQLVLFLLAVVLACGLAVGYRTRLCTVGSWLLFCSIHVRNPTVNYYADLVIIALLFWAMFVPLNGRWSLDAILHPEQEPLRVSHSSWGSQALMLQVAFIYWFSAALKWDTSWRGEGSAIYYALSLDFSVRPLGHWLLGFPRLLRVLTRGTVWFEFVGPALAFSPVWTEPIRLLVVAAFIGFHLALALAMHLVWFSAICSIAWLIFLPAMFWDGLLRRWGRALAPIRIRVARMAYRLSRSREEGPEWVRRTLSVPAPRERLGIAADIIVLAFLLLVFAKNVSNHPSMNFRFPAGPRAVLSLVQLDQKWSMFAPYPYVDDGWFVMDGTLASGRHVDPWRGGEPADTRPADVAATYRDERWRAYLLRLSLGEFKDFREYFGRYLCRSWNDGHPHRERLDSVDVRFMLERTPPPGQPMSPPAREPITSSRCSGSAGPVPASQGH
jgi:hypothetical protein